MVRARYLATRLAGDVLIRWVRAVFPAETAADALSAAQPRASVRLHTLARCRFAESGGQPAVKDEVIVTGYGMKYRLWFPYTHAPAACDRAPAGSAPARGDDLGNLPAWTVSVLCVEKRAGGLPHPWSVPSPRQGRRSIAVKRFRSSSHTVAAATGKLEQA